MEDRISREGKWDEGRGKMKGWWELRGQERGGSERG